MKYILTNNRTWSDLSKIEKQIFIAGFVYGVIVGAFIITLLGAFGVLS